MNESAVGPYRLEETLGVGSLGTTYRAEDSRSRRKVVCKLLRPELRDSEAYWGQLNRDLARLKTLRHRHIAQLVDVVEDRGERVVVQEYVRGHSLQQEMDYRGEALPLPRIYTIWRQILSALGHAHGLGLLHLDLRASKILISRNGEEDRIKILDFGLGPVHDKGSDRGEHNIVELDVHTAYYLSPDQLHRGMAVSPRSDLYSVGVLLYEAATGFVPFGGEDLYAVIRGHLLDTPEAPEKLAAIIPWYLSATILRALAKHPEDRFDDARDFGYHIIACQTGAVLRLRPRAVRVARKAGAEGVEGSDSGRRPAPDPRAPTPTPAKPRAPEPPLDETLVDLDDEDEVQAPPPPGGETRISLDALVSRISGPRLPAVNASPPPSPAAPDLSPQRQRQRPPRPNVPVLGDEAETLEMEPMDDGATTTQVALPMGALLGEDGGPGADSAPAQPPPARRPGLQMPAPGRPVLPRGLAPRDLKPLPEGVPEPSYLALLSVDARSVSATSATPVPGGPVSSPLSMMGRMGGRSGYTR